MSNGHYDQKKKPTTQFLLFLEYYEMFNSFPRKIKTSRNVISFVIYNLGFISIVDFLFVSITLEIWNYELMFYFVNVQMAPTFSLLLVVFIQHFPFTTQQVANRGKQFFNWIETDLYWNLNGDERPNGTLYVKVA